MRTETEQSYRERILTVTPYWRVVGPKGQMNPKFPGGAEGQAQRLEAEGHILERAPGGPRVVLPT